MTLRDHSLLLCLLVALATRAQDPLHRRFTMQDGLPSNTVYRCMQDGAGFLWLSTDAGAVRFDGTNMDRFGIQQGLSDEDVFATKCDSKGRIWFFTANGLPCYVDGNKVHSGRTDPTLAQVQLRSGICAFQEDRDGALWFGGLRGELAIVHPDGTVEEHDIHDPEMEFGRGHVCLYTMPDGRVQVFNGRSPVDSSGRPIPEHSLRAGGRAEEQRHTNERLLIVVADSVEEWRDDHWELLIGRHELPGAPRIANVSPIDEDELWVSLRSGGVLWLRREAGAWVPVRDVMFTQDLITHVLPDDEGNIWLSTSYGGLILVEAPSLSSTFYPGVRGGNEQFLRAHASDDVGVWVGTNQGDVYRLREELELIDLPPQGPLFSKVNSICSNGPDLWVATEHRSFRLRNSAEAQNVEELYAMTMFQERKALNFAIKALTVSPKGRVIGSTYGLYEYDDGVAAFRFIPDTAIGTIRIYAPHFDAEGTLWFEENGLVKSFSGSGYRSYPEFQLEAGFRVMDITSIGDTVFLATNGKGILVLVGDRPFRYITRSDGLSSDHVERMFMDRGELFLTTDRAADRISGPWGAPVVRSNFAGLSASLRRVRDVVADSGNAYVLLVDGLVELSRTEQVVTTGVPSAYIRSVHLNDSLVTDLSIVGIRGRKDRLVVELGAIHFTKPESVSLQYRILPDLHWHADPTGSIDLSSIEAGNHILQVRASIDDRTWSETVEMTVVVVPPLLDRWWARTMMVVLGIVVLYAALRALANRRYRIRMRQLREREQLALIRQRMAMDLHDDLGAELSSILLLTRIEREHPEPGSLERVEQLIGTLTEKVKEVIWSTDPGSDTLEATLAFIQRYVIKVCERHGLRVRTTIPTVLPRSELDTGRRRELFLIAKEAVNNTVKHAGASAFTLIVTVDGRSLTLELADDGVGGTSSKEHSGHGIRNMAKRASDLGATLEFQEVRPHGTRITLHLPIE